MSRSRQNRTKKAAKQTKRPTERVQVIERLLDCRWYQQALQKIDAVLKAFPNHGALLTRRIEALIGLECTTENAR